MSWRLLLINLNYYSYSLLNKKEYDVKFSCVLWKIIKYSWNTINAYSLLSHEWRIPLKYAFMVFREYTIIFRVLWGLRLVFFFFFWDTSIE